MSARAGDWFPDLTECPNGCDLPRYGTHQPGCASEPHDPPREACVCAQFGGRGSWQQHRPECVARLASEVFR